MTTKWHHSSVNIQSPSHISGGVAWRLTTRRHRDLYQQHAVSQLEVAVCDVNVVAVMKTQHYEVRYFGNGQSIAMF